MPRIKILAIREDRKIIFENILALDENIVEEIRSKGIQKCVLESLNLLKECELIYISFDVDSLDSSISKGTGTPVPNGFSISEIKNLLKYFLMSEKICCFEITEVNPTLDNKGNKMAEIAFDILENTISNIN